MFFSIRQHYQIMKNHSNVTEMHFRMTQRAKKEVLGHFLEFGLLDRLEIAYCGRTKYFLTFGNVTRSWRTIQISQKCIFEWSKRPKKRFLAIFLSLVCWFNLILHIVIVLNVLQLSVMLPGHEGSFKDYKKLSTCLIGRKDEFGVGWRVKVSYYFSFRLHYNSLIYLSKGAHWVLLTVAKHVMANMVTRHKSQLMSVSVFH